ncbi:MAG: hypothetical protein ACREFP_05490 [Acetobacteraceae bacterium]
MTVREVPRRAFVLLAVAVAGCATSAPVAENFPALRYNYLPLLKLNVASMEIENDWQPGDAPDHVESYAPETPLAALRQMAKDRLGAYGTSGKAVFVIQDASLVRDNGMLTGSFAVRLEVLSADGTRAGFAQARVSKSANAPSGEGEALRQALYSLTSELMNSMNVEFEYQLRRNLGAWLVQSSATPAAIEAAPLPEPGAQTAPAPATSAAPAPSAPSAAPKPGILGTLPISPGQATPAPTPLMPQTLSP